MATILSDPPKFEFAPAGSRRTFANLAHVVGGESLLRVANLGATVIIARHGGVEAFGCYAAALAYTTVATMITDNGLQVAAIKKITGSAERLSEVGCDLYVTKTGLVLPMLALMAVIAASVHLFPLAWMISCLTMVRVLGQSYCQLQISMLKALDRMTLIGPIQGAHFTFLCAAMLYAYLRTSGIMPVLVIFVIGQTLEFLIEGTVLWRARLRPARVSLHNCYELLRGFTGVGMCFNIANGIVRLDVIALSLIASAVVVGHFAAAQTAILVIYPVSWLFGSVLLPEMTRLVSKPDDLNRYVRHWARLIAIVAIPCTVAGVFIGPIVLRALFGPSFTASGILLSIVLLAAPFIFWNSLYLNLAFALNRPRVYLGMYVATLAFAAALDFSLGYAWAAVGVAVAVVIREVAMTTGFWASARRITVSWTAA